MEKNDVTQAPNALASLPSSETEAILDDLDAVIGQFRALSDIELTDRERRRLQNSGIRRYGLIDKGSDLAAINPTYFPHGFSATGLKDTMRDIEFFRNLLQKIQDFNRLVSNSLFQYSDDAYRMVLVFYNYVRELARTGDTTAISIYNMLLPFFKHPKHGGSGEPTEPEVERDVRALLHGRKSGRIVIENVKPHLVGGVHKVVDEMGGGHSEGELKIKN
jgi:hypothetical protein